MSKLIHRRSFVKGISGVAVAPYLAACGPAQEDPLMSPADAPIGPFGAESTAEEVTEGIDLSGRTVVVTGANSGLGFETMRVLALRGAHVIGTGRTLEKAEAACDSISGNATPAVLELTDFDSIATCTDQIRALDRPIDMLICNAGIMALPELEQVNGVEKQFAVNHLGHFLFVNRLLEPVVAAPQGRVVMVSSMGYKFAPPEGIQFDNLSGERDYNPNEAYGQSKLANGLFSLELARRLESTSATSNSVHPGIIMTNLGRHMEEWKQFAARLIGWTFMKSIPEGAATQCYVAASPALAGVSGLYFVDCNPVIPEPSMHDVRQAARLWEVSEELTDGYLG